MSDDQLMVERVVYLASLVSNKNTIDPMLDTLRFITSQRKAGETLELTKEERSTLKSLEAQLSDYLITRDSVRTFTPESLQAKLADHFAADDPRGRANRKARRLVLGILGMALLGYGAAVAIPAPPDVRFTLGVPPFMLIIGVSIAAMFWSARSILASAMKRSYSLFAAALVISAATSAQYPILSAFPHLSEINPFRYGGFIVPYTIMYILLYIGFYLYTKQLPGQTIRLLQPKWVVAAAIVLVPVAFAIPHPRTADELFFDIALTCFMLDILFSSAAAIWGFSAVSRITARYQRALRLFVFSVATYTIVSSGLGSILLLTGALLPTDPKVIGLSSLYSVALILQISSAYMLKRDLQE